MHITVTVRDICSGYVRGNNSFEEAGHSQTLKPGTNRTFKIICSFHYKAISTNNFYVKRIMLASHFF